VAQGDAVSEAAAWTGVREQTVYHWSQRYLAGHQVAALADAPRRGRPVSSPKSAALRRGGRRPQAAGSPAPRRATRALLRRRLPLTHKHAERLAHVPHTPRQPPRPAIGKKRADKANREGDTERWAAPAVPKSRAVTPALLTAYDAWLRDGALPIVITAYRLV
jgi:hypothetical protein